MVSTFRRKEKRRSSAGEKRGLRKMEVTRNSCWGLSRTREEDCQAPLKIKSRLETLSLGRSQSARLSDFPPWARSSLTTEVKGGRQTVLQCGLLGGHVRKTKGSWASQGA